MRDHDLSGKGDCRSCAKRSVLTPTVGPGHNSLRQRAAQTTSHSVFTPLSLPSDNDWLLKIIAIQGQFVIGLYRRQMKAISYLGKIEKILGVAATTRSWNTIEKVAKILGQDSHD